jgi:hypothetical protein
VLSSFRWIKDDFFVLKSNPNLVINTTCMLLYLSRAIYIFECKNIVYKVYFWVSYFRLDSCGPRLRSWSFRFCVTVLLLASYRCIVYPHIGDFTNLAGYPILKPNIIFCDYLLDHSLPLRMDRQFKEDRKMVPTLKISSIFPKEKYFRYLPYLYHVFARGRATSKHRGGGRYNAILEFKGSK